MTTPSDPVTTNYAISVLVLGLIGISGLVAAISNVWRNIHHVRALKDPARLPPLAEAIAKEYATKRDLADARQDLQRQISANAAESRAVFSEAFGAMRQQQEKNAEFQAAIGRQLGAIQESINIIKGKVL